MKLVSLKRFWSLPLHARITTVVGLVLILGLFLFIVIARTLFLQTTKNQVELRAQTLVDYLTQTSISALVNYDQTMLHQTCATVARQRDVILAVVIDKNGKVIATSRNPNSTHVLNQTQLPLGFLQRGNSRGYISRYDQENAVLEIARPILINNTLWGWAIIALETTYFENLASRIRWSTLTAGILIIIITILVIQRITQRLIAPIDDLIRGTEEISQGNLTHQISIRDEGEFGQLARKFNEMTLKLNYYYRQKEMLNRKLHEYSEELEKRVEERTRELNRIKEEVIQIFHQIPIGLMVCDATGTIRWINEEFLKIFNLPRDEAIVGLSLKDTAIFKGKSLQKKLIQIFESQQKTSFQRTISIDKNTRRILEINTQPLYAEDQSVSGMIFIFNDITLEQELLNKINRTKRLESMGILAGGIAHDFNNLLAIILPNAQMLHILLEDREELLQYVETIERATEQASQLTAQILSFARGSRQSKKEILNLNRVIDDFCSMLDRLVNRRIEIEKHLAENLWNIEADRGQIEQVLMNMTMNSIDAMENGGKIIYRTANVEIREATMLFSSRLEAGQYVKLEVEDTGQGIPPQILDKIFDPFFSSKSESKGTGLGLSTVYGIVKSHGGYIDVRSELGKGTTFSIYLPAVFEAESQTDEQRPIKKIVSGNVLLVDDEEMLQQTVGRMLESLNFQVTIARDGEEAVSIFNKNPDLFDVILMDIQMPRMDGIEAARLIWQQRPNVRIIFSTGYADPQRLEYLRKLGIKQILRKPYKIKDLVDIISSSDN